MWNWLKRLFGLAEKEYHHLLDQAHKLHDDLTDYADRKYAEASTIRSDIEAKYMALDVTESAREAAEDLKAKVAQALTPVVPSVKASPVDGHAQVAAQ